MGGKSIRKFQRKYIELLKTGNTNQKERKTEKITKYFPKNCTQNINKFVEIQKNYK